MANTDPSPFVDYDKFFLFGDSITQGAFDQSSGFVFLAIYFQALIELNSNTNIVLASPQRSSTTMYAV